MLTLHCTTSKAQRNYFVNAFKYTMTDRGHKDSGGVIGKEMYRKNAPMGIRYTKKHPLVVVGDWDQRPLSFLNDEGKPDGFIIDVIKGIFDKIHVPYTIKLMDWQEARKAVSSGTAHLMIDVFKPDNSRNLSYGSNVIDKYDVAIAHMVNSSHVRALDELNERDTIYFSEKEYAEHYVRQHFGDSVPFVMKYLDVAYAMDKLISGDIQYYVCGRMMLEYLVSRYGLQNRVDVDDINIPSGQLRFTSTDHVLLYEMDAQVQRLKDNGNYDNIVHRWMDEEGRHQSTTSFIEIIIIVTIIVVIIILVTIFIVVQRNTSERNLKEEFLAISRMAISLTDSQVLAINIRKLWVHNIFGNLLPKGGLSYHVYESLIHPDDIMVTYNARNRIDNGEMDVGEVRFRMRRYNDDTGQWRTMSVRSFVKNDRRGQPYYVYLVLVDVTERVREQKELDKTYYDYSSITDISDVGMIYFDNKGRCVDSNTLARKLFDSGGTQRGSQYLDNLNIHDFSSLFSGIVIEKDTDMWFTGPLEILELNLHTNVEVRIQSIYDDKGEQRGYAVSIKDISKMLTLRGKVIELGDQLMDLKSQLIRYQTELRFILKRNNMNTLRWKLGNDYIELSRDLLSFDIRLPLKNYISAIIGDGEGEFDDLLSNTAEYFSKPHHVVRQYRMDINMSNCIRWYEIDIVPDYDDDGNFIGAFGMRTDITDFMIAQQRLNEETARAEDSNKHKAIFLANMTHELRTPLNAVSGFAEIMQYGATKEEKEEYLSIMHHNCNMLLSIVDNILQLSTIDTDGIKLREQEVDFPVFFKKEAERLRHYFTNPDVSYQIDSPMASLKLIIDAPRLMQIIDAFVNNASKFTAKGFVRVGYRYVGDMLTIYCRDTGRGIPIDRQSDVFERFVKLDDFVQGTGLGLSVCKKIADRMNGTIDVYSVEGEGTTMSITITPKVVPNT